MLTSPHLEPEDRLSILLTLSHCTEASGKAAARFSFASLKEKTHFFPHISAEAHQFQLVQSGGLPLIITLLTEDTSEEVRKAATFILQACKQASKSALSVKI